MPRVITITGPSGSGKTTLLSLLMGLEIDGFRPSIVTKFATRPPRTSDSVDVVSVKSIPEECDIIYEQYGTRYGFPLASVFEQLSIGLNPIVVLNDVRAVEDVRRSLGPLVRSVFLFRTSPNISHYRELVDSRGGESIEEAEVRFRKAQAIFRIYIENIQLFDHVVLNAAGYSELGRQIQQIVRGLNDRSAWPLVKVGN